ncbi:MAG TPA: hypothetical protein VG269_22370 [Tepidisphaeraceae bacterium]|jgi:hypothetical protein|nr:hypothetical protein [Tepidisphaeraceae bacterium]
MRLLLAPCLGSLVFMTGCAAQEYDIVQPPEFRRHIGRDQDAIIRAGPVEYRMRAVEDRLVIRIFNRSAGALQLLGDGSSVTDPSGNSQLILSGTIPPGGFKKVVLPPTVYSPPTGAGVYRGPELGGEPGLHEPLMDQPGFGAGRPAWEWPAGAEVQVMLTFQVDGNPPFSQRWTIRKTPT